MDENQRREDELQKALKARASDPTDSPITRRTFLHKSVDDRCRGVPPTGGSPSSAPSLSWWVKRQPASAFKFAWISHHLYRGRTPRFWTGRPGSERGEAMKPPADFLIPRRRSRAARDPVELDLATTSSRR